MTVPLFFTFGEYTEAPDYKNKTEEIEKKRDSDIKDYDSMLESIPLNQSRFDSFVDSKLFG